MQQKLAKIKSTHLGTEDHGIFTAYVHMDYGGSSGQSVGGYSLDEPRHDDDGRFIGRFGTAYGMEWIARFIRAAGVDSWEKLPGRTIFVLFDDHTWNANVLGITNLPTEKGETFLFADVLESVQA